MTGLIFIKFQMPDSLIKLAEYCYDIIHGQAMSFYQLCKMMILGWPFYKLKQDLWGSIQKSCINSFPTSGHICCLLITFAKNLGQDVGPDLDPNCLALGIPARIFLKK